MVTVHVFPGDDEHARFKLVRLIIDGFHRIEIYK